MIPDFLPSSATMIQEPSAIALFQKLDRRMVQTCFASISTAYVCNAPDRSTSAPFVLIHGFDSSLLEFRKLFPLLANERETWAIDLFGSGFTEFAPNFEVNPSRIRQHLVSILETWIGQPVILVGASLGGAVAIDLALHYPNVVRSLVLIDSVDFSGSFPVGQFLPTSVIELGADWLYWRKQMTLTTASMLSADPTLLDTLRCSTLHQAMPGWKAAVTAFTQSGGYANLSDRICEIQHPTLILWGTEDNVLGTKDATQFKNAIARSQLVWVEKSGHSPHLDQPQSVAAHLLAQSLINT